MGNVLGSIQAARIVIGPTEKCLIVRPVRSFVIPTCQVGAADCLDLYTNAASWSQCMTVVQVRPDGVAAVINL